jgi:hypothetical protein
LGIVKDVRQHFRHFTDRLAIQSIGNLRDLLPEQAQGAEVGVEDLPGAVEMFIKK